MKRILLDKNVPVPLRRLLVGHEVETASFRGWDTLENGALLDAIEAAGFEVFMTADQSLRFQQSLTGRSFGTVVLGTSRWLTLRHDIGAIMGAVQRARPGGVEIVANPAPRRGRR